MKLFKRILIILLIALAFVGGAVTYRGYDMYKDAVEEVPISQKVLEIRSMENYTAYSQLPETYIKGIIAVEDRRFESHSGVDLISTGRALWRNMKAGELLEGGSTITQQLARNMYFDQDKDISRKLAEMFVAREIEENYEKDEILELYVNVIYFGSGYYGVYDAAMGYFGVVPAQITDYQATMLAGVPNAPSVYSPDVNPDLAEQRRQQVITCMVEEGYAEDGEIQ